MFHTTYKTLGRNSLLFSESCSLLHKTTELSAYVNLLWVHTLVLKDLLPNILEASLLLDGLTKMLIQSKLMRSITYTESKTNKPVRVTKEGDLVCSPRGCPIYSGGLHLRIGSSGEDGSFRWADEGPGGMEWSLPRRVPLVAEPRSWGQVCLLASDFTDCLFWWESWSKE